MADSHDAAAGIETVHLVELAELLTLAKMGYAMRKAQRAYFDARKANQHVNATDRFLAARTAEVQFDRAVARALERERVGLPGMGHS
ncbi:MAG TPA: hypothetical protein VH092_39115 [Urbifossiella sp.]|jgi:hypothetical protein|nr:hypothetical protein [Urbifossiella sp.]